MMMKSPPSSIKKIYGNANLQIIKNRIKYLQCKRNQPLISIERQNSSMPKIRTEESAVTSTPFFIKIRKHPNETNKADSQPLSASKQRLLQLKQYKSKRYRQAKQNSERMIMSIKIQRQKQIQKKRLKRIKMVIEEQKMRQRIQNEYYDKLTTIRENNLNKSGLKEVMQFKDLMLKKQLMREELRSLEKYEESLSLKNELMNKIKYVLSNSDCN